MHLCVMWRINWPNQALQTDRGPCSDSETPSSARALRLSWVVRRRRGVTGWATLFGGQFLYPEENASNREGRGVQQRQRSVSPPEERIPQALACVADRNLPAFLESQHE